MGSVRGISHRRFECLRYSTIEATRAVIQRHHIGRTYRVDGRLDLPHYRNLAVRSRNVLAPLAEGGVKSATVHQLTGRNRERNRSLEIRLVHRRRIVMFSWIASYR